MKKVYILFAASLFTVIFASSTYAQAVFHSNKFGSTGNWSAIGTWTIFSGSDGDGIPDSDDDVKIINGDGITVDIAVTCNSVTIQADGSLSENTTLTVGNVVFTVTGDIDLTSINGGGQPKIITSANATSILVVGGDINFNADDGNEVDYLEIANTSTLKIAGNFNRYSNNPDITFRTFNSIVEYNGSATQTIIGAIYGKLKSSGTGARILESGTTILIKNNTSTCFDPGTNSYTITGSTIEFGGTSTQTIPAFTYNNLTIGSSGTKTLVNGGTIEVKGTLLFNGTNTYTVTNNTINFSGTSPQTIDWNGRTGATLNDIKFNNSSGSGVILAGSITAAMVTGNITVETGEFDNGGFAIAGNGSATFQVNNGATFMLSGSSAFPTGFGTNTLQSTSTVVFDGNGAQTIPAITFGNLTSSNSGGRTLASGTINITGTYTTSNNSSYTVTGNTVNFNGGSAQTIPMKSAQAYNNITINNTSGANLGAAVTATNVIGNITVEAGTLGNGGFAMTGTGANTFQVNDGTTFQLTGSSAFPTGFGTVTLQTTALVDYNGSGSQTIAARSYTNLMSSNTGARTLGSGTIDISGTYTISNVSSSYTVAGNTVNFNGTSAQTIPMPSAAVTLYGDIKTNNTAGATLGALINTTNVSGGITVETGTFDNGGFAITGNGSATLQVNNGATLKLTGTSAFPTGFGTTTLQTTSSTVDYAGTAQTVSGTPTYHHLTISGSGTKTLGAALNVGGNLTISAGTLDAAGFLMNLSGDFTNNATFTHNNNTVDFKGTGTQAVGGSTTTSFYNMKASTNVHTVNMAANANLINKIDVIDGATFDADGTGNDKVFTLVSTSTKNGNTFTGGGTAQVGDLSAGTFQGNVTYQRYMDGFTEWRSLGCPIQSKTIADWDATIYTSGFTGSDDPSSGFISIYTFNAGSQTYTAAANTTDPISADNGTVDGKGFLAYIGNTSPGSTTTPVTLINTGAIVSGTKTPAVSASYNLLANPYPAPLSFTSFYATNSGSLNNDFYYVYDYYTGGFDTWDESMGTSTNGRTSGTIANGQGFYVDVATPGTLTINENHKAGTPDGNFLKLAASVYKKMRLTISSATATPYTSSMIVAFSPVTADVYDIKEDALAMNPFAWNAPTLTSISTDGKNLVINKMADLTKGYSIPVKAKVGVTGTYKITAPDLSEIGGCIVLEDKLTGIKTDLLSTNSYTFTIKDTTNAPRFVLHISNPVVASFAASNTTVAAGTPVTFTNSSTGATSYTWDFGDSNTDNVQNPTHTYTAAGDYTVKLTASNGNCSANTTTQIIHVTSPLGISNSTTGNNDITVITNGNGTFVKLDLNQVTTGTIEVFDLLGKNIHSQSFSGSHKLEQINVPAVGNGIYLVKVSTNETTLTKRIFIGN